MREETYRQSPILALGTPSIQDPPEGESLMSIGDCIVDYSRQGIRNLKNLPTTVCSRGT